MAKRWPHKLGRRSWLLSLPSSERQGLFPQVIAGPAQPASQPHQDTAGGRAPRGRPVSAAAGRGGGVGLAI